MEKVIVNLWGGPGTGKSTTAAHLFSLLKQRDLNVELVREYIKNWVWEGRKVLEGDQIYLAAKQSRAERCLLEKVDIIVTDSPVYLGEYYADLHGDAIDATREIVQYHTDLVKKYGYREVNVFLNRVKKYNPAGRFQNEDEAKAIDVALKNYLFCKGLNYLEVDADSEAAINIVNFI